LTKPRLNVGMGLSKLVRKKGKIVRTSNKKFIVEENTKIEVQLEILDDETLAQSLTSLKLERGKNTEEKQTPKIKNLSAIRDWPLGCGPNIPFLMLLICSF
jgi:hypothetical protein